MTTELREEGFAGSAGGCDVDVEEGIVDEEAFWGLLTGVIVGVEEKA